MTKAEKRVAIAKDVLKHLKVMRVDTGGYITGTLPQTFKPSDDAQERIDQLTNCCRVCALGACMLSHVRLWDKVTMGQLYPYEDYYVNTSRAGVVKHLQAYFSEEQLSLIENAFEGESIIPANNSDDNWDALQFGRRYENPNDRLAAIMRNIIRNQGEFKPANKRGKVGAK